MAISPLVDFSQAAYPDRRHVDVHPADQRRRHIVAAPLLALLVFLGASAPVPALTDAFLDTPHVPPAGYFVTKPNIEITLYLLDDETFAKAWAACNGANNILNDERFISSFTCLNAGKPIYVAVKKNQCQTAEQMNTAFCWELANVAGWNDGN